MIKNAVKVAIDTPPERYEVEDHERGTIGFTVRSHVLNEILRNPNRWRLGYVSPESRSKKFGSVLDCLLLTPRQWFKRYVVVPADAPKRPTKAQLNAKNPQEKSLEQIKWWAQWDAANAGKTELKQEANAEVHAAKNRLLEDELIRDLIEASDTAVMYTAEWHAPHQNIVVPIKALVDIVPNREHPTLHNSLWDLKTTQNASPRSFRQDAYRYGYAIQAALYLDIHNAATGEMRSDFGHVVIENYHPYEFRSPPPLMSQRFLDLGRMLYQRAFSIYCKALVNGEWPSYDSGPDWPITDCEPWMLDAATIYEPISEGEADPALDPSAYDKPATPTEDDITP